MEESCFQLKDDITKRPTTQEILKFFGLKKNKSIWEYGGSGIEQRIVASVKMLVSTKKLTVLNNTLTFCKTFNICRNKM